MQLASVRALKEELTSKARQETPALVAMAIGGRADPIEVPIPPPMAVGAAPKSDRKNDFQLAIRVYKGQKARAMQILATSSIAGHAREIDFASGVRYEPRGLTLSAGGSCGHYRITAGTLGAFVQNDDEYFILSNNHVLANSDSCQVGDSIWRPGPLDVVNGRHHEIGALTKWIPLSDNRVDAALASFSDQVSYFYPRTYAGIGVIKSRPISDRFAVRQVIKRGRTTKVTRGTVSAFELDDVSINYGTRSRPYVATFQDQIEIIGDPLHRPFSLGGDSGSLIIDRMTLKPYALLYGGGPDDDGIDRTVAHFIPDVLDSLDVTFV